jgi:hypothetical protein
MTRALLWFEDIVKEVMFVGLCICNFWLFTVFNMRVWKWRVSMIFLLAL